MAFKPFDGESTKEQFVPWANEYVQTHPKHVNRTWDVQDVKLVAKGGIIECKDWAGWVYKSKTRYTHLLEFIVSWYKSKEPAPVLQIQLTDAEPYFVLGTDDERRAGWGKTTETHWHQHYCTTSDNPEYRTNPLPLPNKPDSPEYSVRDAHMYEEEAIATIEETSAQQGRKGSKNGVKPQ